MQRAISDLYEVAELTNDDLVIIALMVQTLQLNPLAKVVSDLEDLKLEKYTKELSIILDFKVDTIKDLKSIFESKSLDYGIKRLSRTVDNKTNLLTFMEGWVAYKTITAIDNQDLVDKLNNCIEAGFLLHSFTIHPFSGLYIAVLYFKETKEWDTKI